MLFEWWSSYPLPLYLFFIVYRLNSISLISFLYSLLISLRIVFFDGLSNYGPVCCAAYDQSYFGLVSWMGSGEQRREQIVLISIWKQFKDVYSKIAIRPCIEYHFSKGVTSGEAGHCILVLRSHRKKRESARKARERPIRTKMEGHIPRSKLSWLTLEAFWLVSLTIMLRKPYLRGEMYWNHPIQLGKLAVFLNTPEKMKIGSMTIGVTAELAFSSFTMLPMNRPREPPAKLTSRLMKLKRKNCYAVEAWPTIQQMMQLKIKGMTTTYGSSTMFLLRKYGRTPYSLEFSSFRKTSFSEGNTRVTGDSEAIICEMDKKKKQPTMEYQLTVSVQLCLPALKQSPPVQMARNIDWKMRLLRIMGFLTVLMRSLLRSSLKEEEADTLSESLTSTSPVCAWSICFSISGEMCVLQVQKQKGKLYLLLQFQRCIESMKNQAGFISYGILLPSLLEKQSIP